MMDSSLTSMSLKESRCFAHDKIRVGKDEPGTITFNQAYDNFQANQDIEVEYIELSNIKLQNTLL